MRKFFFTFKTASIVLPTRGSASLVLIATFSPDRFWGWFCPHSSDVAENRQAIATAGFTFRSGDGADLADRLRFLIANPAVREAAGQAAKRRIHQHYQWPAIAAEVERVYFEMMGWELTAPLSRKPSEKVSTPSAGVHRRAG
jgi:hypothetical protein